MPDPRYALVTGGAKRVGAAVVRRLAAAGYHVLFTYFGSESDAQRLTRELTERGSVVHYLKIDLEDDDAAANIVRWVKGITHRLDVLMNNASMYVPNHEPIEPLSRRLMRVNHEVPSALMRDLGPLLTAASGRVVNMLDLLADRPMPSYSAYCASKAALKISTLAAARTLAPHVTVNGIAPGVVAWPDDMPLDDRERYLAKVPLGRAGTPENVAALVHFLVTEGDYITGQVIHLDGGRSIM